MLPTMLENSSKGRDVRLATMNTNAWTTAQGVIEWYANSGADELPDLIAFQETSLRSEQEICAAQRWLNRRGLKGVFWPAASTGLTSRHVSAGVGLAVKRSFGLTQVVHPTIKNHSARLAAAKVELGMGIDLLAVSVYLCDGLGLKGPNLDLMAARLAFVISVELPFVLPCGFQQASATLMMTSG